MKQADPLPTLLDPRLAPLAMSPLPAWLWSLDGSRILWANAVGAAIFGGDTVAAIVARRFEPTLVAAAQIARLALTLPHGGTPHLARLRGFGAGFGRMLTCACSRVTIAGEIAILVVAQEPAGPTLSLAERGQRLLAGLNESIAIYTPSGDLLAATTTAGELLGEKRTVNAIDAVELADAATRTGGARGRCSLGEIEVTALGSGPSAVLLASLKAAQATQPPETAEQNTSEGAAAVEVETNVIEPAAAEVQTAPEMAAGAIDTETPADVTAETAPEREEAVVERRAVPRDLPQEPTTAPAAVIERRHPLRFVWQMDADGRFSLGSDEFADVIGPAVAVTLGRPWREISQALDLDPQGLIERAVATHETWSGITLDWPIEGTGERLAVEMSGLPIFDHDRNFRGYRGFGVCRDTALIAQLQGKRAATRAILMTLPPAPHEVEAEAAPTAPTAPEEAAPTAPAEAPSVAMPTEHIAPQPARSETERPILTLVPPVPNVVPFPTSGETRGGTLSPVERNAFAELAQRLSARLKGEEAAAARGAEASAETTASPRPAPGVPAGAEAEPTAKQPTAQQLAPEGMTRTEAVCDLLGHVPAGILVYRHDRFIFANRAFLDWTGYESLSAFAQAGGLDALFIEEYKDDRAAEKGHAQSLVIEAPTGDKRRTKASLHTISWDDTSAMALILSPQTEGAISPDRGAEIRELQSILDTAFDGVVVLDGAGKILSCNRRALALFGYEADEISGRDLTEIFAPESGQLAREYLAELQRGGVAGVLDGGHEVVGRARNGTLIWLFMTLGRVADVEDRFCAVFRNITPWKRAEEELVRARREAERASAAKSEFIAKVSHEIRTPLNTIIGFSEVMMGERFGPVGSDRYREYLKDIHISGEHVLSLLNDLLDLSKIEAGKLDLTFGQIDLNDLTQQTVALMQPQASHDRVIIRTALADSLPHVVADSRSIRQILLNLVSNSIKFTGAGGQVIISTARTDDGGVALRVRDTGAGMSEKDIAVALEPFGQLTTSPRTDVRGSGLGLPLTKALAEANHARFTIRSAVNSGTLVEIVFSAVRAAAE
jgi:PAS domain S-box-containing protein